MTDIIKKLENFKDTDEELTAWYEFVLKDLSERRIGDFIKTIPVIKMKIPSVELSEWFWKIWFLRKYFAVQSNSICSKRRQDGKNDGLQIRRDV